MFALCDETLVVVGYRAPTALRSRGWGLLAARAQPGQVDPRCAVATSLVKPDGSGVAGKGPQDDILDALSGESPLQTVEEPGADALVSACGQNADGFDLSDACPRLLGVGEPGVGHGKNVGQGVSSQLLASPSEKQDGAGLGERLGIQVTPRGPRCEIVEMRTDLGHSLRVMSVY